MNERYHKSIGRRLPGESVSGTGDDVKKLRQWVNKVNHLRNEEQQHCFAEMSQDADYSKRHPSKVAESVAHEHRWRIPVTKQVAHWQNEKGQWMEFFLKLPRVSVLTYQLW